MHAQLVTHLAMANQFKINQFGFSEIPFGWAGYFA